MAFGNGTAELEVVDGARIERGNLCEGGAHHLCGHIVRADVGE